MAPRLGQQRGHRRLGDATGDLVWHTCGPWAGEFGHARSAGCDGAVDLADDHAGHYRCGGDVLFLLQPWLGSDSPWHNPRPCRARGAVCSDYRNRHVVGLRPELDAGRRQPRRGSAVQLSGEYSCRSSHPELRLAGCSPLPLPSTRSWWCCSWVAWSSETIPRQMWAGIREQISPTILAVATFLIAFAVLVLFTVEWLRRRGSGTGSRAG